MEKSVIIENIELSFQGTVATGHLFDVFSAKSGISDWHLHYVAFCYENGRWLLVKDIDPTATDKKKVKKIGRQAQQKYCAEQLLKELGLWVDGMKQSNYHPLVVANKLLFRNDKMLQCYMSAVVHANIASHKIRVLEDQDKKQADAVEPDTTDTDNGTTIETTSDKVSGAAVIEGNQSSLAYGALSDIRRRMVETAGNSKLTKKEIIEVMKDVAEDMLLVMNELSE